jgi:SAM-dependent methyltransferase
MKASSSNGSTLILNLGCGTKASPSERVINIDWSIYLRVRKNPFLRAVSHIAFTGERRARLNSLPKNVLVYNLAKGVPFGNCSVDAVYHSHLLEHLDRDVAVEFLKEVLRVLKPGGIHRICVPDFERACKDYVAHLTACDNDPDEWKLHEGCIATILEQSVRREPMGTSQQGRLRRFIENALLGDARKRGETHQWMYDRISLCSLLGTLGYREINVEEHNKSRIPGWSELGLEIDETGAEYKPGSLYVETKK